MERDDKSMQFSSDKGRIIGAQDNLTNDWPQKCLHEVANLSLLNDSAFILVTTNGVKRKQKEQLLILLFVNLLLHLCCLWKLLKITKMENKIILKKKSLWPLIQKSLLTEDQIKLFNQPEFWIIKKVYRCRQLMIFCRQIPINFFYFSPALRPYFTYSINCQLLESSFWRKAVDYDSLILALLIIVT